MTLTLTLEALCSRNVIVFKEYLMLFEATKYNDNITSNCEQLTLNMKQMTCFEPITCLCDLDLDLKKIIYEHNHTFIKIV